MISFNELKAEEDLSFTLQLPGINRNLEVISEHIGQIEQTILGKIEYTYWTGKIYGPKKYGNFFYVKGSDGAHAGMFQFNGKTFEMLSLNPESGVLREVNHTWAKDVTCGVGVVDLPETGEEYNPPSNISNLLPPVVCDPAPSSCLYPWKILIAYPQALVDHIWQISGYNPTLANLYYALPKITFGTTIQNSGISAPRLSYVDVNIGNQFIPTGNILTDLTNFRSIESTLYSTYQHDRAVLMTLQSYGSLYGLACNPYHTSTGYNTSCDAAIVDWNSILAPQYTFAHELGHLFGGRHEILADPDPANCAHGFIFTSNGGEDRTLMATYNTNPQPNSLGILYFSDPNNTYNGYQLGSSSENNTILIQNIICENTSFVGIPDDTPNFRQISSSKNSLTGNVAYPNPGKDQIYVISKDEIELIEVISSDGMRLQGLQFVVSGDRKQLDIRDLSPGLYFLKVKSVHSTELIKFIKQ